MENKQSMLSERAEEMMTYKDDPAGLLDLYYRIGHDIMLISDDMNNQLDLIRHIKKDKMPEYKSVAQFDRAIEQTVEYTGIKKSKITIDAFGKVLQVIKKKLEGFQSEIFNKDINF